MLVQQHRTRYHTPQGDTYKGLPKPPSPASSFPLRLLCLLQFLELLPHARWHRASRPPGFQISYLSLNLCYFILSPSSSRTWGNLSRSRVFLLDEAIAPRNRGRYNRHHGQPRNGYLPSCHHRPPLYRYLSHCLGHHLLVGQYGLLLA